MRINQLTNIQISESALTWLKAKYSAVDSMNASLYRTFLAEDFKLQFGNNPIASGNNEIIAGIQHFWDAIGGLDHGFINVVGHDYHFAAEALINYTRKDGKVVAVPCVTTIERNGQGLASFIKIFIDTTPIFSN